MITWSKYIQDHCLSAATSVSWGGILSLITGRFFRAFTQEYIKGCFSWSTIFFPSTSSWASCAAKSVTNWMSRMPRPSAVIEDSSFGIKSIISSSINVIFSCNSWRASSCASPLQKNTFFALDGNCYIKNIYALPLAICFQQIEELSKRLLIGKTCALMWSVAEPNFSYHLSGAKNHLQIWRHYSTVR